MHLHYTVIQSMNKMIASEEIEGEKEKGVQVSINLSQVFTHARTHTHTYTHTLYTQIYILYTSIASTWKHRCT